MSVRHWLRALTVVAIALLAVPCVASAYPRKYVREMQRVGHRRFIAFNLYGNRNRISKLIDPTVVDLSNVRLLNTDLMDREETALIPDFGNRLRIARYIDASTVDLSEDVVIPVEPYGHNRMILMKTFGNRNRLEKLVGQE